MQTWALIEDRLDYAFAHFCPGDQGNLRSKIKPPYITYKYFTTTEILKVSDQEVAPKRAQQHHFDRKNARDSMCVVVCVGNFKTCCVQMRDLSLLVETRPGTVYFFLGRETIHRVGVPFGFPEDISSTTTERWSWIGFTHATMYHGPKSTHGSDIPVWLKGRGERVDTPASSEERWHILEEATAQDPKSKHYSAKTLQTARRQAADQESRCKG